MSAARSRRRAQVSKTRQIRPVKFHASEAALADLRPRIAETKWPSAELVNDASRYSRYVAQGGDWGNAVTEQMALIAPPGLRGIHTNMPGAVPANIAQALLVGEQPPALSVAEHRTYRQLKFFYDNGLAYAQLMSHRPQTLYAMDASPIGLAAWLLDHDARSYDLIACAFGGREEGLTRDVLDNITLYWLTNTVTA